MAGIDRIISIAAVVVAIAGTFAGYQVGIKSEATKDFEGLSISAELQDVAKPKVFVPKTSNGRPIEIYGAGRAIDSQDPSTGENFRVLLAVISESEQNSNGYTLRLEDIRPVVCEELQPGKSCQGLEISYLGIEAIFSRGPKSAVIYENIPIPLS